MRRRENTAMAALAMGVFTALVAACISNTVAQPAQVTVGGPTYSADDIRRLEINGLRLGMSEAEVLRTLENRGLQVRVPEQAVRDWYYYAPDQSRWGSFRFTDTLDAPQLEWFTYHETFTEAERADVATRRTELMRLIGRPTSWMQWVYDNRIADRFVLAANQQVTDEIEAVWTCYVDWECHQEMDCRPLVSRANGAVIKGSFDALGIYIEANDYVARSQALLQDERFVRRDYSQAVCMVVPLVH